MRVSRLLVWIASACLALAGAAVLLLRWSAGDRQVETADVLPDGYWVRIDPVASAPTGPEGLGPEGLETEALGPDADAAARVLSLPYAATGRRASEAGGVVFHDPEQTWGKYNLYSSGHGPEAILVDMEGRFVHRWRYPYERAFPERAELLDQAYWRRVRLLDDGSLLVLFQGGGLIRVDVESNLLWRLDRGTYNDLQVTADGTILTLTKSLRHVPELGPEPVLDDRILFVSPEGEPLRQVSLLEGLLRSPFASSLDDRPDHADILHANTVEWIERDDLLPPFRRGRVLFSARELDLVGLLDLDAERVVWARQGPWAKQHEPRFLANGHLLLFDNQGGPEGRSRILEIDPLSEEIVWSFAHESFRSLQGGSCTRLPGGNTLVTSSEGGRAFEITPAGEVVWEFASPHRGGRDNELVAALWEVIRLDESAWPVRRSHDRETP